MQRPTAAAHLTTLRQIADSNDGEAAADSALLCHVGRPQTLVRERGAYDLKWLGRLAALILFEIQAVATSILLVRRLRVDGAFATALVMNVDMRGLHLGPRRIHHRSH